MGLTWKASRESYTPTWPQVPSLFWVLVTLSVVIYVAALAMRATVAQLSSDLQSLGAAARAMRDLK